MRKCKNKKCRRLFVVSARHPNQRYCSRIKCQRARKTKWQSKKIAIDEDYRKNQDDSQQRWLAKKTWDWKKYRENNPEYTRKNREKQKKRDRSKRAAKNKAPILENLAKMDAVTDENKIKSGIYTIIPAPRNDLAKMDALTVKITEISKG